jgi:hypothetical protein
LALGFSPLLPLLYWPLPLPLLLLPPGVRPPRAVVVEVCAWPDS